MSETMSDTATEVLEPLIDERSKVESWRLHVLIEAGYPISLAERLAVSEADLHTACETIARGKFEALGLDLENGERVHVFGRAELYEQRGEFKLRALTVERFGLGAHLATLERLKAKLAEEGLFASERKRALPFLPRRVGVVTGNDAAAKRDVVTTIESRFPPARVLVAETYVQGPRAAAEIVAAIETLCAEPDVDVIVLTRGGGRF